MAPPTTTRFSPGRAYHKHIKGKYAYIGTVRRDQARTTLTHYETSPNYTCHSTNLPESDWLSSTTYIRSRDLAKGMLIVWTKDEEGYMFGDVPPHVVGMLHGFCTIEEVREMSDEEMNALLTRSLDDAIPTE